VTHNSGLETLLHLALSLSDPGLVSALPAEWVEAVTNGWRNATNHLNMSTTLVVEKNEREMQT